MAIFELELSFSADLTTFLRRDSRDQGLIRRMLAEKTAVKDIIEACGVPHSEVDLIVAVETHGAERYGVHFGWPVQIPMRLEIFGVPAPADVLPQTQRLQTKTWCRFVADGHLGKLARNLRLLGLDTAYERDADDCRILEIMTAEDRALLTATAVSSCFSSTSAPMRRSARLSRRSGKAGPGGPFELFVSTYSEPSSVRFGRFRF
jgi:hypothetical protein